MTDLLTCDLEFTISVGYSVRRPIAPDERTSTVTVLARTHASAVDTAVCMVAGRRGVAMVTRADVLECVA
jgi:hypothetical protein